MEPILVFVTQRLHQLYRTRLTASHNPGCRLGLETLGVVSCGYKKSPETWRDHLASCQDSIHFVNLQVFGKIDKYFVKTYK